MPIEELFDDGWIKCDCGAQFQIIVNAPSVFYENAEYCPYCGVELEISKVEPKDS